MTRFGFVFAGLLLSSGAAQVSAAQPEDLKTLLGKEIIGPRQTQLEVEAYVEPRIPKMPDVREAAAWEEQARRIRANLLDGVVYRGEAAKWRDAKLGVEWLDTIAGGPGYRIKKLRYEALPGMWIPALLYEPEKLTGKVPVGLAVNGHDGNGKAAPYKQIRCINMAKRGMLVLNVEWLGMGQLRTPGYGHYRMNQLDLCGTSGLAPFYLCMKRGLDVLLAHEHADPERVSVSGLSGGGWQTIYISALDTRVKLANPVAGYSSFRTRIKNHKDLGDSEQTPCDMAVYADYTHLTAMMAPRPTLLTYNAKDECCFEAGYALPPLIDAAGPIFKLLGKQASLRSHVNHDPGTHNYERENREAFYKMLGDHFFTGDKNFDPKEIPSEKEVKTREELAVELPAKNADFNTLALSLCNNLRPLRPPNKEEAANEARRRQQKQALHELVKAKDFQVKAEKVGSEEKAGTRATFWKLKMGDAWTVPVVELVRGEPKTTALLLNDAGRAVDAVNAERLLAAGHRVLAVDLFYFGESKIEKRGVLFALMIATIGDRALGLQSSELAAIARWSREAHKGGPVTVVAVGPRTSTIAVVAAALEEKAIGRLELHGALGSLKELIEQSRSVDQMPELFCFGLLQEFDCKRLVTMVVPRPVRFVEPSERVKKEMGDLKEWYALFGREFDPLR